MIKLQNHISQFGINIISYSETGMTWFNKVKDGQRFEYWIHKIGQMTHDEVLDSLQIAQWWKVD